MEVANRKIGLNGRRTSTLQFNDDIEEFAISDIPMDTEPMKSISSPSRVSLSKRRSSVGGKKIAEMYKTVIQMANENKLNDKNSWNYDLIDHMRSLIRDDSREVNFQKASCTLDASVKIYSHRVDDTYNASHRILEALSRNGNHHYEDEADSETKADGEGGETQPKTKKAIRAVQNTIEKNPEALNAVKVENEYAFDPLFQKMSKAFDEGGAKGMLLYNLRLAPTSCALYFPEKSVNAEMKKNQNENMAFNKKQVNLVNMSDLVKRSGLTVEKVNSLSICPKLQELRNTLKLPTMEVNIPLTPFLSEGPRYTAADFKKQHIIPPQLNAGHDISNDCVDLQDDIGATTNDEYDDYDSYGPPPMEAIQGDDAWDTTQPEVEAPEEPLFDAPTKLNWLVNEDDMKRNKKEVIQPMVESLNKLQLNKNTEYGYFTIDDLNSASNAWAGASHWKYTRKAQAPIKSMESRSMDEVSVATPATEGTTEMQQQQGKKKAIKSKSSAANTGLKFTLERVDESTFGKSATKKTDSTLLTKNAIEKLRNTAADILLPKDEKLKVSDLSKLYLLPNYTLAMGKSATAPNGSTIFIDKVLPADEIEGSSMTNENGTKFQFYDQDDYYDEPAGMDDAGGYDDNQQIDGLPAKIIKNFEGLEIDNDNLVRANRKVEKIQINYATISKKVNVHKLKADIWTNLQENLDETKVKETPTKAESEPEEVPKKNDPPKISFQHLVEDIEETNNQKDTSLQYYFICLLHLANENGLMIKGQEDMSDLTIQFDPRKTGAVANKENSKSKSTRSKK